MIRIGKELFTWANPTHSLQLNRMCVRWTGEHWRKSACTIRNKATKWSEPVEVDFFSLSSRFISFHSSFDCIYYHSLIVLCFLLKLQVIPGRKLHSVAAWMKSGSLTDLISYSSFCCLVLVGERNVLLLTTLTTKIHCEHDALMVRYESPTNTPMREYECKHDYYYHILWLNPLNLARNFQLYATKHGPFQTFNK